LDNNTSITLSRLCESVWSMDKDLPLFEKVLGSKLVI